MLFIEYHRCSTCHKAKKWLDEHNIEYTDRHIVEDNPSFNELKEWYERSGLPLKKFFNTSGMLYKEMNLKDKLPAMSDEEQLKLLATNGMLLVVNKGRVNLEDKAKVQEMDDRINKLSILKQQYLLKMFTDVKIQYEVNPDGSVTYHYQE